MIDYLYLLKLSSVHSDKHCVLHLSSQTLPYFHLWQKHFGNLPGLQLLFIQQCSYSETADG